MSEHEYRVDLTWTGNRGTGTSGYRDYDRAVTLSGTAKPDLLASADPHFRGDGTRWNPEELLLAALAECHLLSYLHAAVSTGVIVVDYSDEASAAMTTQGNSGRITSATLRPRVTVADPAMVDAARAAHALAHQWCFIANSVAFEVHLEPETLVARPTL
ncbi:MAG TPA: OsmC family protein [Propioniciclava sp.]|jgi:organic hydroperoxide reductase OsmC/OhrA|uniref:OsmC family protein n=1 Tax=Propioniciclava sp. TaxID=2038686 RepID=UPI002BC754F7|nr:OsmC family protein [Propioniciclava sp.]HRL47985.1 OsmC family protein [Propioniciclava sp.]HRL80204.1 OsmC family protein [Propioniciclava sp.]